MPRLPSALRIHFEVTFIGKLFAHAKRSVNFKFAFEGDSDEHSVVVKHTLNSGKKVIFLNGSEIFTEEKVRAHRWRAWRRGGRAGGGGAAGLFLRALIECANVPPPPQVTMGQFVYPFQVQDHLGNQHLLTFVIEAQVTTDDMYGEARAAPSCRAPSLRRAHAPPPSPFLTARAQTSASTAAPSRTCARRR
jgi:hypothetical protein